MKSRIDKDYWKRRYGYTGQIQARPTLHTRPVDPPPTGETTKFLSLRPTTFDEYIGQDRHVQRLKAAIETAKLDSDAMAHAAFISEAGTGKTTLAACCASELGRTALGTVGSALRSMEDIADLVKEVDGGIAFIDEAHDLAKSDVPIISGLLPLLEDWNLHTGEASMQVKPFTCIMATTSFGMLDKALRSRMGIPYTFDAYTNEDMCEIALLHAEKRGMILPRPSAVEVAQRARGNPRYCLNLMRECYNMAASAGESAVQIEACQRAFDILGLDEGGMNPDDRRLLGLLSAGPCSLSKCASYLGMDRTTFEETIETFLFRGGYITTNSRGRMLTKKGEKYVSTHEGH